MDRRTAIAYLRQLAPGKEREIEAMLGLLGVSNEECREVANSGMVVFVGCGGGGGPGTWTPPPGPHEVVRITGPGGSGRFSRG